MAEGLATKRRIRAGHKGSATRILHQVDGLLEEREPELETDKAKLSQLKLSLQEKLETLKLIDREILELTEEDKLVDEIEQADAFKERIYAAMVRMEKHSAVSSPSAGEDTSVHGGDASTRNPPTHNHHVKLPKLQLRAFNGDITTWTTFWDSYDSAIHQNDGLSDHR